MDIPYLLSCSVIVVSALSLGLYLIQSRPLWKKSSHSSGRPNTEPEKRNISFLDMITDGLLASPTNTIAMPSGVVITANPANIEHILKNNFDNYPKGDTATTVLEDFLGRGIFNSDGDHWRLQRKTASLEFTTKTIRTFVMDNVRSEVTIRLLPLLSNAAATGETLDLQDALDRLAFDNVCKVALDIDPARLAGEEGECGRFASAFETVAGISIRRFQQPRFVWRLHQLLGIGPERQLKKELTIVNDFAMKVVKERKSRKEETKNKSDLLSRFIAEGDFSDEFLRDIVVSFVLAGRDTTSTGLAWFFWVVSSKPEVQKQILDEIQSVRSKYRNSDDVLSMEELREMEYLHAAVSESLRLYPPVPVLTRTCAGDDTLPDGTAVRKGRSMMFSPYAMGRIEGIWGNDCKQFRPERWLNNGLFRARNPFQFPVFHAGPRMCLGREMAYTQMKAVAAAVIERFSVEVAAEGEREHELAIVLRMKGGLPVRLKERQGTPPAN